MTNKITFKIASKSDEKIIFSWLAEPHMIEFWDNTKEHKDDILNFIHGRKQHYFSGTTKYFIGLVDNVPFAFILADVIKADDDVSESQKDTMYKFSNTIALDFGIGNPEYLGKGLASQTLEKFILYYQEIIDPTADTFFIDPDENNPKAKRAYEKAGFQHIGSYKATKGAFIGQTSLSMIKKVSLGNYIDTKLAKKLIITQFPEYADLNVTDVEHQGHDNRTYRIGNDMLIRMPTAESYALKVPKEQELLQQLAKHLSIPIPAPIKMGKPSSYYPYPFSIYEWLPGESINLLTLTDQEKEQLAFDLAKFLTELQGITDVAGPGPGQHNFWRGDHVSVYDKGTREQIANLAGVIDSKRALGLWERACATKWRDAPVWIHGDFAVGNMLWDNGKLSAVIDLGGTSMGDPACDLVIAWTYFSAKARDIFISAINLDNDTWLRARAWALWKATFVLCQITDKNSPEAQMQKQIISNVLN